MNQRLENFLDACERLLGKQPWLDAKSAVRRVAGSTDWRHDPERLATAEAKRARKRAKRAYAAD